MRAGENTYDAVRRRSPTPTTGMTRRPVTARRRSADGLPAWLDPVVRAADTVEPEQLSRFLPPESGGGRQSAVLILFGEGDERPRAAAHRARRQPSLARGPALIPRRRARSGGRRPGDHGPLRAALREAEEETGLDPAGVQVFGVLPKLYIPVSGFVVTPVLGWWRRRARSGRSIPPRPRECSRCPWRISPTRPTVRRPCTRAVTAARPFWSRGPWSGVSPRE